MAKIHENLAFEYLKIMCTKDGYSREELKQKMRDKYGNLPDNVLNIAITRATKRFVEAHPEFRK